MLGRKQSVRNNEDWKNALDHIEETVPKKELDFLVKSAESAKPITWILTVCAIFFAKYRLICYN